MKKLVVVLLAAVFLAAGCYKPHDPNVNLRSGVRSDSIENNIITKPFAAAVSALIGQGLVVDNVIKNRDAAGLLEIQVSGHNQSPWTKRFQYKVEWLDEAGMVIQNKTSVWMLMSAMGSSPYSFKAVAPTPNAVDFRVDTRKEE